MLAARARQPLSALSFLNASAAAGVMMPEASFSEGLCVTNVFARMKSASATRSLQIEPKQGWSSVKLKR